MIKNKQNCYTFSMNRFKKFNRFLWVGLIILWVPTQVTAQEQESEQWQTLQAHELEWFGHMVSPPLWDPAHAPTPFRSGQQSRSGQDGWRDQEGDGVVAQTGSGSSTETANHEAMLQDLDYPVTLTRDGKLDERIRLYLERFRTDERAKRHAINMHKKFKEMGPFLQEILLRQGAPKDLVFVAMVESGLNPNIRSSAGAMGLWQFISSTGTEYGLTQNRWIDWRRDPIKATEAAAKYLMNLHDRLGSWELTFAAYNMGYGGLLRTMQKYNTNDFWALTQMEAALPFETILYVSKIISLSIIHRHPENFGLVTEEAIEPYAVEGLQIRPGTSLATAAKAAGVSVETLKLWNPALLRNRLPPNQEYPLRISVTASTRFKERFVSVAAEEGAMTLYTVRLGETVRSMSRLTGCPESEIRRINELGRNERIVPFTQLFIPTARRPAPFSETSPGTRSASASSTAPKPMIPFLVARKPSDDHMRVFYKVVRGDTLDDILKAFKLDRAQLVAWNHLQPRANLQEGLHLQIFVPKDMDLSMINVIKEDEVMVFDIHSGEFFEAYEREQGRVRLRVKVKAGDTLSSLASQYRLPLSSLQRINRLSRDATLHVGQDIIVYVTERRGSARHLIEEVVQTSDPASTPVPPVTAAMAGVSPAADVTQEESSAPVERSDEPVPAMTAVPRDPD